MKAYAEKFLEQIEPEFRGLTGEWNRRATLDAPKSHEYPSTFLSGE